MASARARTLQRLPPEVNRALYVRNLPFKITSEEMYDIFGKYGAIRQIRLGDKPDTRGTAARLLNASLGALSACMPMQRPSKLKRCARSS